MRCHQRTRGPKTYVRRYPAAPLDVRPDRCCDQQYQSLRGGEGKNCAAGNIQPQTYRIARSTNAYRWSAARHGPLAVELTEPFRRDDCKRRHSCSRRRWSYPPTQWYRTISIRRLSSRQGVQTGQSGGVAAASGRGKRNHQIHSRTQSGSNTRYPQWRAAFSRPYTGRVCAHGTRGSNAAPGSGDRHDRGVSRWSRSIHRPPDRNGDHVCRPGSNCHGKCPLVPGSAKSQRSSGPIREEARRLKRCQPGGEFDAGASDGFNQRGFSRGRS